MTLLIIINQKLTKLEDKFTLLKPHSGSRGDEYWYIILKKVQQYLSIDYKEDNLTINQLECILNYIQWFKSQWPLRINKKGNYILPKQYQPPEI